MKDENNDYLKYAQIGIELTAAVLAGCFVGYKLDIYFDVLPWLTLGGIVIGMAAGFYLALRGLPGESDAKPSEPAAPSRPLPGGPGTGPREKGRR